MGFTVRLTRAGIRHETGEGDAPEVWLDRPTTVSELLRFWHYGLEAIDAEYTLGDLLDLLRGVSGVGRLGGMFFCDVEEFLAEAVLPPPDDHDDLFHLEVYNGADLSGWVDGPRGRRVSGGRSVRPYRIYRGFHGWGPWESEDAAPGDPPREGGIAIEFTPVNELVHLPLRYNPKVRFEEEPLQASVLDTTITITFGEFVHAVVSEIGFFGTPGDRNEARVLLDRRMDELDRDVAEDAEIGEPFDFEEWMAELDREAEE
jgi:hypothetical protein